MMDYGRKVTRIKQLIFKSCNSLCRKDNKSLFFFPHPGCYTDRTSLLNYKSDNAISFLHYMLEYHGKDYTFNIAISCRDNLEWHNKITKEKFHNIDIHYFYFYDNGVLSFYRKICYIYLFLKRFSHSKFFFTSSTIPLSFKTKKQIGICLGYYANVFKNDSFSSNHKLYMALDKTINCYDKYITCSSLANFTISSTTKIALSNFVVKGFSRNDELLKKRENIFLRKELQSKVEYEIKHIFLYVPTHRDYEQTEIEKRCILGFGLDKEIISEFLRKNNAVILCKIHSKQNIEVVSRDLPDGIIINIPNQYYGLTDMMIISDCLINDYSSTYFDYLLLDKPVLFNFYDFDQYEKYRGFSYDPIDPILAGEVFVNQEQMINAMSKLLKGEDNWIDKRCFLRSIIHKYVDVYSSERIYDYIFNKD
jgi:hypothetical protein